MWVESLARIRALTLPQVLMLLQILKWFISWQYRCESRLLGWPVVFLGLWVTSLTQSFVHQTSTNKRALEACRALLLINTYVLDLHSRTTHSALTDKMSSVVQSVQLFAYVFCEWFPFAFYRRTYNWLSRREKAIFWVASVLLVWVNPKFGTELGAIERKPYSRAPWDMGRIAAKGLANSAIATFAISIIPLMMILEKYGIDLLE